MHLLQKKYLLHFKQFGDGAFIYDVNSNFFEYKQLLTHVSVFLCFYKIEGTQATSFISPCYAHAYIHIYHVNLNKRFYFVFGTMNNNFNRMVISTYILFSEKVYNILHMNYDTILGHGRHTSQPTVNQHSIQRGSKRVL